MKFFEKENGLNEIYFPVQLGGGLKGINVPSENSNTSDFDENKSMSISKISPFYNNIYSPCPKFIRWCRTPLKV